MSIRLHSKMTFVQRRLFPWVAAGVVTCSWLSTAFEGELPWQALLGGGLFSGLILLVIGGVYWAVAWPLMDEAVLTGTTVTVRRGKVAAEFPLAAVRKVTWQTSYNPQRVTFHLDMPTPLGQEISFMPPGPYLWGRPHPIVAELRQRMSEAHEGK